MIPLTLTRLNGKTVNVDLTRLQRLAEGTSQLRPGWASTLTFCQELDGFVELSEAPQDVRGNSQGAALEVDDTYAERVYGKTRADV